MKTVTVAELVAHLQTLPQDTPVAYSLHSEYCLLELDGIEVKQLCHARPDGWIHDWRPDKTTMPYLVIT